MKLRIIYRVAEKHGTTAETTEKPTTEKLYTICTKATEKQYKTLCNLRIENKIILCYNKATIKQSREAETKEKRSF